MTIITLGNIGEYTKISIYNLTGIQLFLCHLIICGYLDYFMQKFLCCELGLTFFSTLLSA